jgi:hypothetical protein
MRRATASPGGCPSTADDKEADDKERGLPTPSHFYFIAHRGACDKPRLVPYNRWPRPESYDCGRSEMRMVLAMYGSRGDVEPLVALAARWRALAAVAEGSDALVAGGVMPAGGWR